MNEPVDAGVGTLVCNGCGAQAHATAAPGMTGHEFREIILTIAADLGWTREFDDNGALDWCPACTLARKAATN